MKGTKTLRTIGAVALSAAVGLGFSTSAQALKFVDAAATDPGADGSTTAGTITYAKETLLKARSANIPAGYYAIGTRDHYLAARAALGALEADTYVLTYTLEGMVFAEAPTHSITVATIASGGAVGDKEVVWRVGAAAITKDTTPFAMTAKFAVSAEGGSVTLKEENRTFGGMKVHPPVMINVASALKVTAMPADPAPQAKSASQFMNFGGPALSPTLRASLGTFEVGVAEGMDVASGTDGATPNDLATDDDVNTLDDITAVAANADGSVANPVTFSVNTGFGFVKTLALADDATTGDQCTGTLTDIRKPVTPATTPATYTDETKPMEAQTFELNTDGDDTTPDATGNENTLQHLCVVVDGETSIPETGPFMVRATYKGIADAAFPPMATTSNLASITRDGTTVRIPYLTTYEGYNQRLVLHNRAAREVSYTVTFHTEDGVMADPMAYMGTLMAGQLKTMRVQEMTTLSGGSRAAATVTSEAADGMLSVATTLVNREDRSTDTETHKQ